VNKQHLRGTAAGLIRAHLEEGTHEIEIRPVLPFDPPLNEPPFHCGIRIGRKRRRLFSDDQRLKGQIWLAPLIDAPGSKYSIFVSWSFLLIVFNKEEL